MAKRLEELSKAGVIERLDDLDVAIDPNQDVEILCAKLGDELRLKRGTGYHPQDEAEAHAMGFDSEAEVAQEIQDVIDNAGTPVSEINDIPDSPQFNSTIKIHDNDQNDEPIPIIDPDVTIEDDDALDEAELPHVTEEEAEEFDLAEGEELIMPPPQLRAKPTSLPNKRLKVTKAQMMDIQRKGKLIGQKQLDRQGVMWEVRVPVNFKLNN